MTGVRANDPGRLRAAYRDLGLKEISGAKHNPRVVEMFAQSGHAWVKDDETAWCAAAVGSWLKAEGLESSGSLAARSYLKWGKATKKPKRGDIVVFKRGGSSWQGHVAFFLWEKDGRITVLGGNQRNKVSVASYPKAKLLGYRKPSTLGNSKVAGSAATLGAGATVAIGSAMDILPGVVDLVQPGENGGTNWPLIIILLGVLGIAAFLLWDRRDKIKRLGI